MGAIPSGVRAPRATRHTGFITIKNTAPTGAAVAIVPHMVQERDMRR